MAASDAFFPFVDGIQELINVGVNAIIQPGGSINDKKVIAEANKAGIAMVFTGTRHFKHQSLILSIFAAKIKSLSTSPLIL